MPTLRLKCLNKPGILKRIGRPLLTRFFEQFAADFNSNGLALPPPELADADYFNSLAQLLMRPEALPDALNEALVAVDDLSAPQGFEALERSPGWPARQPLLKPDSTSEDIALQLWLADSKILLRVHNPPPPHPPPPPPCPCRNPPHPQTAQPVPPPQPDGERGQG